MSYGKEIFRPKYKETMDSLNTIKDNYYALDQEYQWSSKEKDEEIERLNNIINEFIEDTSCLLEIINRNEKDIKVYQDEWLAIKSVENKLQELKGSDK